MSSESSPVDHSLHPSPDHGLLECPDCDASIVGNYRDLILHYLDTHATGEGPDGSGEASETLTRIKRAQQQVRLDG
jgi:hypothetical protein